MHFPAATGQEGWKDVGSLAIGEHVVGNARPPPVPAIVPAGKTHVASAEPSVQTATGRGKVSVEDFLQKIYEILRIFLFIFF